MEHQGVAKSSFFSELQGLSCNFIYVLIGDMRHLSCLSLAPGNLEQKQILAFH